MQNHPGVFIVLEGSDGSGKTTQFNLLKERLRAVGYDVAVFDFPRYDHDSSHFIKRYLNGDYGPASDVNPYTASMFYALDRYEAATDIRLALSQGKIVLANRYAGSNMAHQGAKFTNTAEQRGFFVWADSLEFQLLGIPRPNFNVYLRVPAELSFQLITKKAARSYTDKTHDQHEADIDHLKRAVETYDLLCQLFPKDFYAIDCSDGRQMLGIPAINNKIWQLLLPIIKNMPRRKPHSKVVNLNAPATTPEKKPEVMVIKVEAGSRQPLNIKLRQISLLAARYLASSPGLDVKLTLLKDARFYDLKLNKPQLSAQYKGVMRETGNRHQLLTKAVQKPGAKQLAEKLNNLLTATTPLAYLCDADIETTPTAIGDLARDLADSKIEELRIIGRNLHVAAKKKAPAELADFKKSDFGNDAPSLTESQSLLTLPGPEETVRLISATPRNEFELLIAGTYKNSSLSQLELSAVIDGLTYEQKSQSLNRYLESMKPGANLAPEIEYQWEVLASGFILDYLLENSFILQPVPQPATPRYGYEVPDWVGNPEIEDLLVACFDDSLSLFSQLQSSGYDQQAQYAVLAGHRLRWRARASIGQILKLKAATRSANCPTEAKLLLKAILQAISQVHPLIGAWLLSSEVVAAPAPSKRSPEQTASQQSPKRPRRTNKSRRKKNL